MPNDQSISTLAGRQASEAEPSGRLSVAGEIGFIGLGRMGTAMAANLATPGRRVIAYIGLGLRPTMEFANLFECEVVVSMLPDDDAVRDVVLGREDSGIEGLASGLKRGAIHLSMSTISTAIASQLAAEHERHGQGYVAAPVFGNPDAAKARQLMSNAASRCSTVSDKRHLPSAPIPATQTSSSCLAT